jgi:hypothetical protein
LGCSADSNIALYALVRRRRRGRELGWSRKDVLDESTTFSCMFDYVKPVQLKVHIQFLLIRIAI